LRNIKFGEFVNLQMFASCVKKVNGVYIVPSNVGLPDSWQGNFFLMFFCEGRNLTESAGVDCAAGKTAERGEAGSGVNA
jgi:hypothetical protein